MKSARRLPTKVEQLSLLFGLVGSLGLLAAKNASAAEYYVATTGSDSNTGTIDKPFATLQKGASAASAGDTVYIRGGTYTITTPANSGAGITITKSGTSDTNRIKFWAYQGETPVFDFSKLSISGSGYTHGIVVTGSWLHFKGLEICNVPMNSSSNCGMHVDNCSNNIFELMNFHHNKGTGVFVDHGTGGHKFINCDSHDNNDAANNGENADGFGVHYQTSGDSTTFNGCRAWYNSDDGWDFISQEVPVTVENCWAMGSGKSSSGDVPGNGNGFKAGSSKSGIRHVIRNCVAWNCRASGFYANHSSGGNDWYNNTAYNNSTQFNMYASTFAECKNVYQCNDDLRQDGVKLTGTKAHKMRNNIGYPNKNSYVDGYGVDTASNTWDLGITPAAGDFASVTDTGFMGSRQADGSLPNLDFMKLAAGSKMIDQGTDVGLLAVGKPDLGAYEYGATGGGGSPGTGGTPATGGATGAGGRVGTGGATGGGGVTGTGGRAGGGGTAAVGGASGTGGTAAVGGAPGTGGTAAVGGAPGTGGTAAVGGVPGTGGTAATGGRIGSSGTGGVTSAGGAVGTGGAGTGGTVTTGGAVATGGVSASGGVPSTSSPVEAGGSVATGGTPKTDATGSTTTATGTTSASGGCSCRLAAARTTSLPGLALLALLMVAVRLRKRR